MKWLDRWLQVQRFKAIAPFLNKSAFVLDIGSGDGAIFRYFKTISGIGLDDGIEKDITGEGWKVLKKNFPDGFDTEEKFDAIAMLAVVEHLPQQALKGLPSKCSYFLKPGGLVLITVPDAKVDHILKVLKFFKMIDGMSLEQHHGFNPSAIEGLFKKEDFFLVKKKKFELRLNNIYIFQKT